MPLRESNSTNITKKINTLQCIDPQGQPGIDGPPGPPVSYQNFTGSQENLYYYNHPLTGPTRSSWTKGGHGKGRLQGCTRKGGARGTHWPQGNGRSKRREGKISWRNIRESSLSVYTQCFLFRCTTDRE